MNLYILRELWTETYDCPDNGLTNICETYVDINISSNKKSLDEIAEELNRGLINNCWSEKKISRLRSLYSGYDCMKESKFIVEDVTELLID